MRSPAIPTGSVMVSPSSNRTRTIQPRGKRLVKAEAFGQRFSTLSPPQQRAPCTRPLEVLLAHGGPPHPEAVERSGQDVRPAAAGEGRPRPPVRPHRPKLGPAGGGG